MKTKKIEKYSAEYWRELDKERRMTDKLDRDCLLLTNFYQSKHYDEETGELIVDDSGHVKSVKRFRIILEGCLIALGLPTRIANEANI